MHRIYIVEDHPKIQEALCEMVETDPTLSVCGRAANGATALREVPTLAPDLLLVDLSLPDMNGYALIRKFQELQPTLPAIIVSGHPASQYRDISKQYGAAEYIDKLDAPVTLLPAIREVLGDR